MIEIWALVLEKNELKNREENLVSALTGDGVSGQQPSSARKRFMGCF